MNNVIETFSKLWSLILTGLIVAFYKELSANKFTFKEEYFWWYGVPFVIMILIPIVTHWKKHSLSFSAEWTIDEPLNREKNISDKVELSIDIFNRVSGKGINTKSDYKLYGHLREQVITLIFNADGKYESGHTGVVFLKKTADFGCLEGEWTQISSNDDILKGSVKMLRK